jgi:Na+-transporting NADH:ubiquinone oxidoreductase subunit A
LIWRNVLIATIFMLLLNQKNEGYLLSMHIKIKKGLDLQLSGKPEQSVSAGPEIQHVALCGHDYIGLKPRLLVSEGDKVVKGQPLFIDKRNPEVNYCSPAQGVVAAINRGPRRILDSVVIRLQALGLEDVHFEPLSTEQRDTIKRTEVAERLQKTGLWAAFQTRPFSQTPLADSSPDAIFVTALDSRPLCPEPAVIARTDPESFIAGLRLLPLLTNGAIYLCKGPEWDIETPAIERLEQVTFSGPHPAGLAGTHIHHLHPVSTERVVWHIDYQDVMAIGKFFTDGEIPTSKVIALSGECLLKPRLIKTLRGASTEELLVNEFRDNTARRVISGSVINGRTANANLAYLGRYHRQVTVLPEGGDRRLFGWMFSNRKLHWSSSQNGRFSGMIAVPAFEKLMPLDILPAPLLRALLVKDTDQAQALGCLELSEEDLALCAYMCPAKTNFGEALRINLDQIEREG